MSRLSQDKRKELRDKVVDVSLPDAARKAAYEQIMDGLLNPKTQFDPQTFDPMDGVDAYDIKKRPREEPSRTLPTMGMKPKKLFEGQMIGMFESKQDLYLLIAWLSERVTALEDKLEQHGIN